jgi:hypothetical protein
VLGLIVMCYCFAVGLMLVLSLFMFISALVFRGLITMLQDK